MAKRSSSLRGRQYAKKDMQQASLPLETSGEGKIPKQQQPEEKKASKRMIYYQGNIRQRATEPGIIVDSAIAYVKSLGGYVESRRQNTVVLRVPVKLFRDAYDSLLQFATVLSKSLTAQDITESFQDTELRIQIAQATLERLKELLKTAVKDADKMRLLNEIKRVSENLEQLEARKRMLQTMADFSRITLTVVPHEPLAGRGQKQDIAAFRWINRLDPFDKLGGYRGDCLEFTVPGEMVALEDKKHWEAVSADGVRFWSRGMENNPRGSTDFWFRAIKDRIGKEFKESRDLEAGGFRLLRSVSFSARPYVYIVGVRQADDDLEVVEIYYPSEAHEKRYSEGILKSITTGVL
jgi:hypothetical protein